MSAATAVEGTTALDVPCPVRRCSGAMKAWCGTNGTPRADGFHDERWRLGDLVAAHLATLPAVAAAQDPADLAAARDQLRQAIAAVAQRGRLHLALEGADPGLDDIVAAIARGTEGSTTR